MSNIPLLILILTRVVRERVSVLECGGPPPLILLIHSCCLMEVPDV
jgi:hypothetical protein